MEERTAGEVGSIYRITVEVPEMARAVELYAALLGTPGRSIRGVRHYFDCGPVILALVDVDPLQPAGAAIAVAKAVYLSVRDLDAVHARAARLGCLDPKDVHGASGAEIHVRPWGERSFYVRDPWNNELCFVDATTIFDGHPR